MDETTKDQVAAWRVEIEAELAEARQALADAEAQLVEARDALATVITNRSATHEAVAPLGRTIASALYARLDRGNKDVHRAEGAVGRAVALVGNANAVADDLRIALAQIAQLTAPPEPAEELAEAVVA